MKRGEKGGYIKTDKDEYFIDLAANEDPDKKAAYDGMLAAYMGMCASGKLDPMDEDVLDKITLVISEATSELRTSEAAKQLQTKE